MGEATMAVLHVDEDPCTTIHLPHTAESVGRARRLMVDELAIAGLRRDLIDDATIVLTELLSNACEHGRPDANGNVEVAWCLHEGHLRISAFDGGHVPELSALPFTDEMVRGRGLALVDFLCDNWEHDSSDGTRVTAELHFA
jgi:serine/threonine-protein kinase RsbW